MACKPPSRLPSALLLGALLLSLSGCLGGAPRYPRAGEGRLVVERNDGDRLVDAAARATYCAGDSILLILAVDTRWSAGLALRARFPLDSARTYRVRPALEGEGTAAAAFRAVTDSVEPGLLGVGGTVSLDTGLRASGRFQIDLAAPTEGAEPGRLLGAFRALPTKDTSAACGATPRNP